MASAWCCRSYVPPPRCCANVSVEILHGAVDAQRCTPSLYSCMAADYARNEVRHNLKIVLADVVVVCSRDLLVESACAETKEGRRDVRQGKQQVMEEQEFLLENVSRDDRGWSEWRRKGEENSRHL